MLGLIYSCWGCLAGGPRHGGALSHPWWLLCCQPRRSPQLSQPAGLRCGAGERRHRGIEVDGRGPQGVPTAEAEREVGVALLHKPVYRFKDYKSYPYIHWVGFIVFVVFLFKRAMFLLYGLCFNDS